MTAAALREPPALYFRVRQGLPMRHLFIALFVVFSLAARLHILTASGT